jgi:hypothetical protein
MMTPGKWTRPRERRIRALLRFWRVLREIVEGHFADIKREIGNDVARGDYALHRQVSNGCERVSMAFERGGATPCAEHSEVAQEEAHELEDAWTAVGVRNNLEQIVRRIGELRAFHLEVKRAMLLAHGARRHALRAVVERAEQRIPRYHLDSRRAFCLG